MWDAPFWPSSSVSDDEGGLTLPSYTCQSAARLRATKAGVYLD